MEWKITIKTIQFTYVHYFPVISSVEVLGLIHTCIACVYYLYLNIKRLVYELNSYTLAVFNLDMLLNFG